MAEKNPNNPAHRDEDIHPENEQWAQQKALLLADREANLPGHIRSRLTAARHQAIERGLQPSKSKRLTWPALAATTAFAALMTYTLLRPATVDQLPLLEDIEMAAAQETELLEELEFIAWMEALEASDAFETPSQG